MRSWLIVEEIFKVYSRSIQLKLRVDGNGLRYYELIETILSHRRTLQLFQVCLTSRLGFQLTRRLFCSLFSLLSGLKTPVSLYG